MQDNNLKIETTILIVKNILKEFEETDYEINEYYENWKVHVQNGKENEKAWTEFEIDIKKVISN